MDDRTKRRLLVGFATTLVSKAASTVIQLVAGFFVHLAVGEGAAFAGLVGLEYQRDLVGLVGTK